MHSSRTTSSSSSSSVPSNATNPNSGLTAQSASHTRLHEKKKEHAALLELERKSSEYVRRLEAVDLDCHVMADAGRVIGEVLSQWPEMCRILSLSLLQNASQAPLDGGEEDKQGETPVDLSPSQACERLVRVPIEELQQQQMQQQQSR